MKIRSRGQSSGNVQPGRKMNRSKMRKKLILLWEEGRVIAKRGDRETPQLMKSFLSCLVKNPRRLGGILKEVSFNQDVN